MLFISGRGKGGEGFSWHFRNREGDLGIFGVSFTFDLACYLKHNICQMTFLALALLLHLPSKGPARLR